MKNAIILHGRPSKTDYYSPERDNQSDSHWISWLQRQLMRRDIFAATPEMPLSYAPDYNIWKKEFERYDIIPDTILVGHSRGGGFIVRWLSEHPKVKVGKVVLVAPSLIPFSKAKGEVELLDFKIDPRIVNRTKGITIFDSSNDSKLIRDSAKLLIKEVEGIQCREFKNYGHFCFGDMKTHEFPELLEEVLR